MGKAETNTRKYEFLDRAQLTVAVVDIEAKELVFITTALTGIFGETNKNVAKIGKWFSSFLKQPDLAPQSWVKNLINQGVTTHAATIQNEPFIVSATILNRNAANIVLLQFQYDLHESSYLKYKSLWSKLIENIPEATVIHTDKGIEYLNEKAERMFNAPLNEVLNKPLASLFKGSKQRDIALHLKQTEDSMPRELTYTNKNGKQYLLSAQTVPLTMGNKQYLQTMFSDISLRQEYLHERMRAQLAEEINAILKHEIKEHKITQYELEQAKNFNQAVIESSLDMIVAENDAGKISVFNQAAEECYGYKREEMIGKSSAILFSTKKEHERIVKALKNKEKLTIEVENKTKSGRVFTSLLAASELYTTDGKYLGSMGVSRDISDQKKSAAELKKSESLYRDLFNNMSDAYLLIDADGNLEYWNKAGLKLLNITNKMAEKANFFDWVYKPHKAKVKAARSEMQKSKKNIVGQEFTIVNAKGKKKHVQTNSSPIFEKGVFKGSRELLRDVSDQKIAREEAEAQSAKIKSIFESSTYLIWSVDTAHRLTSFNTNYAKIYEKTTGTKPKIGYKSLGFSNKKFNSEKELWLQKYELSFAGISQSFESIVKGENHQKKWYDVVLNPIFGYDGEIKELSGIAHSITFKKQAEGKIKEQAAKINSIFDSTAMWIWTLDTKYRITSYNANFAKMLHKSYDTEVQIGGDFFETLYPFVEEDLRPKLREQYDRAIDGQNVQFEGPVKKKNGQVIWIETFLSPIIKDGGKVGEISCMAHEVTDKKIIEKQIRDSLHEKEILLQEVHHRVKNNLQVISSIINLQTSYVKDRNTLNILRESQNRIKSMSFIHESLYQTSDFSSIDFSDYILSLSKNLIHSYTVKSGLVELKTNFEQVFLNLDQAIPCGLIVNELVSNALKYAFPDDRKGTLQIRIKEDKGKIFLEIADNGVGVPAGFDFENSDTLGLQLVFTLIEQLDGEVSFESKPNKGTEYLITFDKIN